LETTSRSAAPVVQQGLDERGRDATQPEAAGRDARAGRDVRHRRGRVAERLAGLGVDDAELGAEPDRVVLEDEEHLGVAVVEVLVDHRVGDRVDAVGEARLRLDVTAGGDGADACDERGPLDLGVRHRVRVPAHLRDRRLRSVVRCRAPMRLFVMKRGEPVTTRSSA
jgi:hypothetical protein